MKSMYQPPSENDDIDTGVFEFQKYGKCMFRPKQPWSENPRSDIITFDDKRDHEELSKNFKIGSSPIAATLKARIVSIVKQFWDSFAGDGARRPIIGYEFGIDTGTAQPVCKFTIRISEIRYLYTVLCLSSSVCIPVLHRSDTKPANQQTSQPVNQSISQSVNQSVSQSVNQSIS